METGVQFKNRILGILAGFGVFYLVVQIENLIAQLISSIPPLLIIVRTANVMGAGAASLLAGYMVKEKGVSAGILIAGTIVFLNIVQVAIVSRNSGFWSTLGGDSDAPMTIKTWFYMIACGVLGGWIGVRLSNRRSNNG